jgi:hypothetical protein
MRSLIAHQREAKTPRNQKGHGFSRAINPRATRASALPKAVVKPEGRND